MVKEFYFYEKPEIFNLISSKLDRKVYFINSPKALSIKANTIEAKTIKIDGIGNLKYPQYMSAVVKFLNNVDKGDIYLYSYEVIEIEEPQIEVRKKCILLRYAID